MNVEEYAKKVSLERKIDDLIPRIIKSKAKKNGMILDLGSGDGIYFHELKGLGFNVFGFDESITRAKRTKKWKRDKIAVCDAQNNCFKGNCFDAVICVDVIEHVLEPKQLVKEAARNLKNSGFFLVTTPNYPAKRFYDFVAKPSHFFYDDPTHVSRLNYFKLKWVLEQSFLEVETTVNHSIFDKKLAKNKWLLRKMQMLFGHKLIAVCSKPKKAGDA